MVDRNMSSIIQKAKRIIVKIGSSLLTKNNIRLDDVILEKWVSQISELKATGREVILVSSGAISTGMLDLSLDKRPTKINELKACAAIGQMRLAQTYEAKFRAINIRAAQILLTQSDLINPKNRFDIYSTLITLLEFGVVAILNENDVVVNNENRFGDNDTLAAQITNLIEGDILVILTDQKGLYTADPRKNSNARLVREAVAGDPLLEKMAGDSGTSIGRGGMISKILAAKYAASSGAHTIIAWGNEEAVLTRLVNGEDIGTQLIA